MNEKIECKQMFSAVHHTYLNLKNTHTRICIKYVWLITVTVNIYLHVVLNIFLMKSNNENDSAL